MYGKVEGFNILKVFASLVWKWGYFQLPSAHKWTIPFGCVLWVLFVWVAVFCFSCFFVYFRFFTWFLYVCLIFFLQEKHMSSTDINALTRQKELLLQKLSTFEETNRTLRELLAEQQCREVRAAVCGTWLITGGCVVFWAGGEFWIWNLTTLFPSPAVDLVDP